MRIELSEELLKCYKIERHHPGLVAIIPGAPIAFAKMVSDRELDELFSVTEDAKFGFAGQDFSPTNDGCLAGAVS